MSWFEDIGIPSWSKWCRRCGGCNTGYPTITQEGRLAEGYLPGINGSGLRLDDGDPVAEAVESAVARFSVHHPAATQAFRDFHVKRYPYGKIRRRLRRGYGLSLGDNGVDGLIAEAGNGIAALVKQPG